MAAEALESRRNRGVPELPLFASQALQIARARRDELAIRDFLERKRILTVPAWMPHYGYRPMPAYLAPLAAFGEGTDFPQVPPGEAGLAERPGPLGTQRRPGSAAARSAPPPGAPGPPAPPSLPATRYIPPPSRDLGYFALSMARDPRPDMVHEGVPGHAFQLALSRRHPDEIRRHWYDSSANEGLGFYAEEMMLAVGLFDAAPVGVSGAGGPPGEKAREMIWNYARLRALRVEVDVRLALGSFTIDQAASYLAAAVPMDAATARSEAAAFAAAPGFAIGYQIGKLQIVDLLAEARRRQGAAFDLRAFHDFVWRNGNVPLALQRWELLGLRDQVDALAGREAQRRRLPSHGES